MTIGTYVWLMLLENIVGQMMGCQMLCGTNVVERCIAWQQIYSSKTLSSNPAAPSAMFGRTARRICPHSLLKPGWRKMFSGNQGRLLGTKNLPPRHVPDHFFTQGRCFSFSAVPMCFWSVLTLFWPYRRKCAINQHWSCIFISDWRPCCWCAAHHWSPKFTSAGIPVPCKL